MAETMIEQGFDQLPASERSELVGHAMIFTMFLASVRGERPDIGYKRRIWNAATAVVEYEGGSFHIVKEFF